MINATGVWADRIRPDEIHDEDEIPRIAPSRGTHVTVSLDKLAHRRRAACIVPAGEDRTIFALPWYGRTLIGTTDRDYDGDIDHVEPSGDDIDYLLERGQLASSGPTLGRADITGAYAGVRPLISTGDPRKSVDISRKAELYETSSGMLTITGGKLTTWRRMAKQVVDRMVEREGREAPCRTGRPAAWDAGLRRGPRAAPATCGALPERLPASSSRFRYGHVLRRTCCGWPASARSWRGRSSRAARPAGRGRGRRALRAGALGRRRAPAPHPPGAARRAAAPDRESTCGRSPRCWAGSSAGTKRAGRRRGRAVGGRRRRGGDRSRVAFDRRLHLTWVRQFALLTGGRREAVHRHRIGRRGRGDRPVGGPRRRHHQPLAARQGGGRSGRHHQADLRPGRRPDLGRGRLRRPRRDDRRGPRAGRAARARRRQGPVLQGGPRGHARAHLRRHPGQHDPRLLAEPGAAGGRRRRHLRLVLHGPPRRHLGRLGRRRRRRSSTASAPAASPRRSSRRRSATPST